MCIFLLISASFVSCYKDRFDLDKLQIEGEWSPDFAVPAIYSNMTMKDILNDYDHNNIFVEDGSGLLTLVYWNKVYSRTAEEVLVIPDQFFNTTYSFYVTGGLPWGTNLTALPYTTYHSFTTPNDLIITNVKLQSGYFDFIINIAKFNHNATINISIPSAKLGGVSFSQDVNIIDSATTNAHINLSGYNIVFDNSGGNQNRLAITYTVTVHGQNGANNSPYTVYMSESFTNFKFEEIHGNFKQISFDLPKDSIEIRMFNHNVDDGVLYFKEPMIRIYATNSFGMPIQINLNDFHSTSGYNYPYDVEVTGFQVPWDINAPSIVGQSATTEDSISNSSVRDAINIAPQWFVTDITGLSNPFVSDTSNFALANSRFDIDAKVELPLYGTAKGFVLVDTVDLNLGEDIDVAEYVEFRINTTNGFPITAMLQLYFLDENNIVLDSMLKPSKQIVTAGLTGAAPEYLVYQPSHEVTVSRFVKSQMTNLKKTKKILIRANLATADNGAQIVKIYSFYNLEVRVGVRAKFNVVY